MLDKEFKDTVTMLKKFSRVIVLDTDDIINFPAGALLLQGQLEQCIHSTDIQVKANSPRDIGKKVDSKNCTLPVKEENFKINGTILDRNLIGELSAIKPDHINIEEFKHADVCYTVKEKYSVVLVFSNDLSYAWSDQNTEAFSRVNDFLKKQVAYTKQNTMLVSKSTLRSRGKNNKSINGFDSFSSMRLLGGSDFLLKSLKNPMVGDVREQVIERGTD